MNSICTRAPRKPRLPIQPLAELFFRQTSELSRLALKAEIELPDRQADRHGNATLAVARTAMTSRVLSDEKRRKAYPHSEIGTVPTPESRALAFSVLK